MKISARLKALRSALGLTQPEAANKFHIPVATWKNYEKGQSEPGAGAMRGLAEGGVNVHWLLTGAGSIMLNDAKEIPPQVQTRMDIILGRMGNEESLRRLNIGKEGVLDKFNGPSLFMKEAINAAGYSPPPATLEVLNVLSILNQEGFKDLIELSVNELAHTTSEIANKYAKITLYDQISYCLEDIHLDHKISQMAISKDWLKLIGLNAENCALIKAKNNDMEPTIKYSDLLFLDTRYKSFSKNGLYALFMDGRLIIRRIQQCFDFDQQESVDDPQDFSALFDYGYYLEFICDSPPYKSQRISREQAKCIEFVGLVKWFVREL